MDEQEATELLQYTQRALRASGMEEVVDRFAETPEEDRGSSLGRVVLLLDMVEAEMRLEHGVTAERIEGRLHEVVHGPEGRELQPGLWLDLAPAHQELFGDEAAVNLTRGPDLSAELDELAELRAAVVAALEDR